MTESPSGRLHVCIKSVKEDGRQSALGGKVAIVFGWHEGRSVSVVADYRYCTVSNRARDSPVRRPQKRREARDR